MPVDTTLSDVLQELAAIKRLLMYKLLREGCSQADVAKALGVNQSSVSRIFTQGSSRRHRDSHADGDGGVG